MNDEAPSHSTTNLVDVLDHVVTEFDVERIARTDEIDGAPPCVVAGTFDAWARALRAIIGGPVLLSPRDPPVWLHLVATRREVVLSVRDETCALSESELEGLYDTPAFEPVVAAVEAAGGAFHVETATAFGGRLVRVVLPLAHRARVDHSSAA
ncbi:MAG: hypothetical protein U0414_19740 [Polyangiaceae bacterium]